MLDSKHIQSHTMMIQRVKILKMVCQGANLSHLQRGIFHSHCTHTHCHTQIYIYTYTYTYTMAKTFSVIFIFLF